MKSKEFTAIAKRLLPNLPGFSVQGPMAVMRPVKLVLRGIYFEGSSFDAKSFYAWAFFLPLFVPTGHVSFNLGRRLRSPVGGDRWSTEMPNLIDDLVAAIERDALPLLSDLESPVNIAQAAEKFQTPSDPYVQEAIAYAWARAGDIGRANVALEKLTRLLDPKVAWQRPIGERADWLKASLLNDPAEAQAQLEAWEFETVQRLGLVNLK